MKYLKTQTAAVISITVRHLVWKIFFIFLLMMINVPHGGVKTNLLNVHVFVEGTTRI